MCSSWDPGWCITPMDLVIWFLSAVAFITADENQIVLLGWRKRWGNRAEN